MIVVHHLNNSRSHRVIWLLEELGLEYEIVKYQRHPKYMYAPASMKKIHPLGKSPTITDGDITLAESGAIIEYVLYRYGNGRMQPAAGTNEWAQYLFWLHFAEGSFMPLRLLSLVFERAYAATPFFIKPIVKTIKEKVSSNFIQPRKIEQLNYLEITLEKNQWLAGESFSAADIQMGVSLIMSGVAREKDVHKPKLLEYIERLKSRSAYIKTIEIAGPLGR